MIATQKRKVVKRVQKICFVWSILNIANITLKSVAFESCGVAHGPERTSTLQL